MRLENRKATGPLPCDPPRVVGQSCIFHRVCVHCRAHRGLLRPLSSRAELARVFPVGACRVHEVGQGGCVRRGPVGGAGRGPHPVNTPWHPHASRLGWEGSRAACGCKLSAPGLLSEGQRGALVPKWGSQPSAASRPLSLSAGTLLAPLPVLCHPCAGGETTPARSAGRHHTHGPA